MSTAKAISAGADLTIDLYNTRATDEASNNGPWSETGVVEISPV